MYIQDKEWDEIISSVCDCLEYLDTLTGIDPLSYEGRQLKNIRMTLHAVVNITDQPIPRKKRPSKQKALKMKAVKDRNHRIEGWVVMREFSRYFIARLAAKYLRKIKKHKRKT